MCGGQHIPVPMNTQHCTEVGGYLWVGNVPTHSLMGVGMWEWEWQCVDVVMCLLMELWRRWGYGLVYSDLYLHQSLVLVGLWFWLEH